MCHVLVKGPSYQMAHYVAAQDDRPASLYVFEQLAYEHGMFALRE